MIEAFGAAEICEFEHALAGEEHIRAFKVFMHDLVVVEIGKGSDQLTGEMQVSLQWRWPKVFVKVLQSAGNVLHEDASLFGEMVMFEISDDVFVVYFRENGYFRFGLFFVFLAEVDLLDG